MYNRYMRNDDGSYTRIPEEEPSRRGARPPGGGDLRDDAGAEPGRTGEAPDGAHARGGDGPSGQGPESFRGGGAFDGPPPPPFGGDRGDGLTGFLRHFLDRWHLDSVDTGDLLLLGLLFFLFREDADEELLVALGLLLIL